MYRLFLAQLVVQYFSQYNLWMKKAYHACAMNRYTGVTQPDMSFYHWGWACSFYCLDICPFDAKIETTHHVFIGPDPI